MEEKKYSLRDAYDRSLFAKGHFGHWIQRNKSIMYLPSVITTPRGKFKDVFLNESQLRMYLKERYVPIEIDRKIEETIIVDDLKTANTEEESSLNEIRKMNMDKWTKEDYEFYNKTLSVLPELPGRDILTTGTQPEPIQEPVKEEEIPSALDTEWWLKKSRSIGMSERLSDIFISQLKAQMFPKSTSEPVTNGKPEMVSEVNKTEKLLQNLSDDVKRLLWENNRLQIIEKKYLKLVQPGMFYSFAKVISLLQPKKDNVTMGRNMLFRIMRERKVLKDNNFPYPQHEKSFLVETISVGPNQNKEHNMIFYTAIGLSHLKKFLVDNGWIINNTK